MGVLLCNENELDEMGTIMAHYMELVPGVEATGQLLLSNGGVEEFDNTQYHSILFGGDQLG